MHDAAAAPLTDTLLDSGVLEAVVVCCHWGSGLRLLEDDFRGRTR